MSEVRKVTKSEFWAAWAKGFLESVHEPMSKEVTSGFMACIFMEKDGDVVPPELEKTFSYQVVMKRAEFVGLHMTKAVAGFISVLSRSPGDAVMYVYALKYAQERDHLTLITTETLANLFPMGFLTDAARHTAWDAQKDGGANVLDHLTSTDLVVSS